MTGQNRMTTSMIITGIAAELAATICCITVQSPLIYIRKY